jgi:hypothetical protein
MPLFEQIAVRYMTDLIRDFPRLEDFQAAGFPGNFGVESTGFTDVTENNPLGGGAGGLGHAQWTGRTANNNRRLLFEQYIDKRKSLGMSAAPDDYETNYGMVFRELDGAEGRRTLPKLYRARDVDEAVEIVMTEYERPGVLHLEKRKEYGRRALAAFRAAGIDVAKLREEGRPGGEPEILPPALPGGPQLDLGRILAILLPLLQHVIADPKLRDTVLPLVFQILGVKPDAAKPIEPVKTAPVNPVTKGSLLAGLAALLGGGALQLNGTIAPPVGETATLPGILTTLAPIAIAAFGGPIGGIVSRLFSGISFSRKTP